ncbi:GNAT family N-acetyltransferase [Seohaeicola saemankumensis]|uniref:GNAT family N-acetyltransferase n=1 Tax=Seohaeicola saemankumensis TaxID=481181 RepID=UPI001E41C8CC|nr:GNAT family N-acetyltransferase [Seohaeicola saemankumensis]MCD1627509.1 GNAT family N-acetyltransferase [Seohaeicola saemankumensis]
MKTPINVRHGNPQEPEAMALLDASHALMQSLFPAEENHYLSIEELCVPDVLFLVAQADLNICGTIALACKTGYGEVKSMFVAPEVRGQGVARLLLNALEHEARDIGLPLLRLETGNKLDAAIALYTAHGFVLCGPFGDYRSNDTSVFMEKPLV